jgi:hypothetical protein
MKEVEALMKIQSMTIDEKIATLSPTDKAYIKGYIERAVLETRKYKPRGRRKKAAKNENAANADEGKKQ